MIHIKSKDWRIVLVTPYMTPEWVIVSLPDASTGSFANIAGGLGHPITGKAGSRGTRVPKGRGSRAGKLGVSGRLSGRPVGGCTIPNRPTAGRLRREEDKEEKREQRRQIIVSTVAPCISPDRSLASASLALSRGKISTSVRTGTSGARERN